MLVDIKLFLCEYAFVRTTVDLPDELFRQVKAKAALEGTTLKQMLRQYIQRGLCQAASLAGKSGARSRLPVLPRRGGRRVPNLTPELQAKLEQKDDLAKFRRSFGR